MYHEHKLDKETLEQMHRESKKFEEEFMRKVKENEVGQPESLKSLQ